ncbi:MAG TPA: uridine diphosphate-N-acetylglucosamine-binding protein YvcK [Vicinamibacterales bacterium]|nr:uridine diphosphate-N-acetylglucosamine-binding protein YvcK [Vicinamibacterales bacterium]
MHRFAPLSPSSDDGSSVPPPPPRFVAIGGGTGLPVVLQGLSNRLRAFPAIAEGAWDLADCVNAIVTVTDDGGSSGWLRRELGVLPPGDVRNCLSALTSHASPLSRLLQYRFTRASHLTGHTVGNLLLAALTQITGDFALAVEQLGAMLGITGRVFPSTREHVILAAEFDNGVVVRGETAIVKCRRSIRRVWLERPALPLPEALRALVNADAIIVGPGSLYTSVLPNLLVGGVAPTIRGASAVRIYVANLMTQAGETTGFTLEDHLRVIREHAGTGLFDYVLVNTTALNPWTLRQQKRRGAEPVTAPEPPSCADQEFTEDGIRVMRGAFAVELSGAEVRHSPDLLSQAIFEIAGQYRTAMDLSRRPESWPRKTKGAQGSTKPPALQAAGDRIAPNL